MVSSLTFTATRRLSYDGCSSPSSANGGTCSASSSVPPSSTVGLPTAVSLGQSSPSCLSPKGLIKRLIIPFSILFIWLQWFAVNTYAFLKNYCGFRFTMSGAPCVSAPIDKSIICSFSFDNENNASFYARLFPGMQLNCYRDIIIWVKLYSVEAGDLLDHVMPMNGPVVAIDLGLLLSSVVTQFDLKNMMIPSLIEINLSGIKFLHFDCTKLQNVRLVIIKLLSFDGYVGGGNTGSSVDPMQMINVAASVGATTIAAHQASTLFRNTLESMVEVKTILTEEEEGWIRRDRQHVNFTKSLDVSHDHPYLAACREIIRRDFEKTINLKTTTQRTLVLGASIREYKEYNQNAHIYFQFANLEGKDMDRTITTCLAAVKSIKLKKCTNRQPKTRAARERNQDDIKSLDAALDEWRKTRLIPERILFWDDTKQLLRSDHKTYFDALVFQDVGYNFDSHQWGALFRATGALTALGYMCLPWELLQPEIISPPGYSYKQQGGLSYLGYHGYSNGYVHKTTEWQTLMQKCVLKYRDFDIGIEFISRVGPMTLIRLFKTNTNEIIVRHLEVPDYLKTTLILDVNASYDRKRSTINVHKLKYFGVRTNEFNDAVNYGLDIAKESVNFNNILLFIRRRSSGISLISKALSKSWSVPPARIPAFALVVYLYVLHISKDFIKFQEVAKETNFAPFTAMLRRRASFVSHTISDIYEFFCKNDMFEYLVKDVNHEFWQQGALRIFRRQAEIMVNTGPDPEDYLPDQFNIIEEEQDASLTSCCFCVELKDVSGEQVFTCQRDKDEDFFHNFSLTNSELTHLRTTLADTSKDPVGLKTVKEDALRHTPLSTFDNRIRVKYLCGPPGTGKSYIIRALATRQDLVLAPFSRLKDDYTNFIHPITKNRTSLKFHTQHTGFLALNHSRIFVDEFTAMPYECLAVIVNNCGADEVVLVGDHKQTGIIQGVEGISIESKIDILKIRSHELIKNFRNPSDVVNVLNTVYGYRMVATNTNSGFVIDVPTNYANYDDHTPLFFKHTTAAQFGLSTETGDKVTVRANQGATYFNTKVVVTNGDQNVFNMPSMAIVALSRHVNQCILLIQDSSVTAAFKGLILSAKDRKVYKRPDNISPIFTNEEIINLLDYADMPNLEEVSDQNGNGTNNNDNPPNYMENNLLRLEWREPNPDDYDTANEYFVEDNENGDENADDDDEGDDEDDEDGSDNDDDDDDGPDDQQPPTGGTSSSHHRSSGRNSSRSNTTRRTPGNNNQSGGVLSWFKNIRLRRQNTIIEMDLNTNRPIKPIDQVTRSGSSIHQEVNRIGSDIERPVDLTGRVTGSDLGTDRPIDPIGQSVNSPIERTTSILGPSPSLNTHTVTNNVKTNIVDTNNWAIGASHSFVSVNRDMNVDIDLRNTPTDNTCLLSCLTSLTNNTIDTVWHSMSVAIGNRWALSVYNKPLSTDELKAFCMLNNIIIQVNSRYMYISCGMEGPIIGSLNHDWRGDGHFSISAKNISTTIPLILTKPVYRNITKPNVVLTSWETILNLIESRPISSDPLLKIRSLVELETRISDDTPFMNNIEKQLGIYKGVRYMSVKELHLILNCLPRNDHRIQTILLVVRLSRNNRFWNVLKDRLINCDPTTKLIGASTVQVKSLPDLSVVTIKESPPEPLNNVDEGFKQMARLFVNPTYLRNLLVDVEIDIKHEYVRLEQSSFNAFKMLIQDFVTIEENNLTLTNQESLGYLDKDFGNGMIDMTVLDNLNPRGHPKRTVEKAWCLLNVAPGVTYFKSNLAQSLRCLQARYLTRAYAVVFNHESLEKAREIADLFFNEHMQLNFDIFNEQDIYTTVHESEHAMKIKNYDKQATFDLFGDSDVRFSMKDIFKPLKGKIDLFKAGQGISAWSKDMQTIFQSSFRLINKHFINSLKPHVVYDNGVDEFTLMLRINALFSLLPHVAINGVIDATACDSGQNKFTQMIERRILERLEISSDFLDWYYQNREQYTLKGYGVIAKVKDIKTSGEPATLLNNTILMACLMNYIIRGEGPCVIVIKGDDGLKRQANMSHRQDVLKDIRRFLKMDFKVDINIPITFCGYFLSGSNLIPDIIRKCFKILGHRFRDYEHFCEYQQSLRDWVLVVNKLGVTAVCEITAHNYNLNFEYCYSLFHSIVSLTHINRVQFLNLFTYRTLDLKEDFISTEPWSERLPWYEGDN